MRPIRYAQPPRWTTPNVSVGDNLYGHEADLIRAFLSDYGPDIQGLAEQVLGTESSENSLVALLMLRDAVEEAGGGETLLAALDDVASYLLQGHAPANDFHQEMDATRHDIRDATAQARESWRSGRNSPEWSSLDFAHQASLINQQPKKRQADQRVIQTFMGNAIGRGGVERKEQAGSPLRYSIFDRVASGEQASPTLAGPKAPKHAPPQYPPAPVAMSDPSHYGHPWPEAGEVDDDAEDLGQDDGEAELMDYLEHFSRYGPPVVRQLATHLLTTWEWDTLVPLFDAIEEYGLGPLLEDNAEEARMARTSVGQALGQSLTDMSGVAYPVNRNAAWRQGRDPVIDEQEAAGKDPHLEKNYKEARRAGDLNQFLAAAQRPGYPYHHYSRPARYSESEKIDSFPNAFAKSGTEDQQLRQDYGDQFLREMGLEGVTHSAIGDWDGGAEEGVITEIPRPADLDLLRYVGAWQGLTGNQHSVLAFAPQQGGPDSVYQMTVPETDVARVRQQLSASGIPYRTLIPGAGGTRVVVFDEGRSLRDSMASFAEQHNAPIRETIGRGEYVGGPTRADARAAFRDEIARFESSTGRRPQTPPR